MSDNKLPKLQLVKKPHATAMDLNDSPGGACASKVSPVEKKVVDILANQPHMQGPAICLECKHTWHAVAPVGVTDFECPSCGTHKGVFDCVCYPETTYKCLCGNMLFALSFTGNMICAYCGNIQSFDYAPPTG